MDGELAGRYRGPPARLFRITLSFLSTARFPVWRSVKPTKVKLQNGANRCSTLDGEQTRYIAVNGGDVAGRRRRPSRLRRRCARARVHRRRRALIRAVVRTLCVYLALVLTPFWVRSYFILSRIEDALQDEQAHP